MANRPSRVTVSIPYASSDGRFYGRYPQGNAPVSGVISGMWANDGLETVAKSERRISAPSSALAVTSTYATTNAYWDGSKFRITLCQNETGMACFYPENNTAVAVTGLQASLSTLVNGVNQIATQARTNAGDWDVNSVTNYTGRNLEVFIPTYLEIQSASCFGYNTGYPNTFPVKMQGANWSARPLANQYVPVWCVPMEWYQSGFQVDPFSNQMVICDIYVPVGTPTGVYTGTFSITQGGSTVKSAPIEVTVLGYSLPHKPSKRMLIQLGEYDIGSRWAGANQRFSYNALVRQAILQNAQMVKRHHLIPHSSDNVSYGNGHYPPLADTAARWNGTAYASTYNYDGFGYNTPEAFTLLNREAGYPMQQPIVATGSGAGAGVTIATEANGWAAYMSANFPTVDYGFYSYDEPPAVDIIGITATNPIGLKCYSSGFSIGQTVAIAGGEGIPGLAGNYTITGKSNVGNVYTYTVAFDGTTSTYTGNGSMSTAFVPMNAGFALLAGVGSPGNTIRPWVTGDVAWHTNSPNVGMWASTGFDFFTSFAAGVTAFKALSAANEVWIYNTKRPSLGSVAPEDDGTALPSIAWAMHKKGVDGYYYWNANFYLDYQSGRPTIPVQAVSVAGGTNIVTVTANGHGLANGHWVAFSPSSLGPLSYLRCFVGNATANTFDLFTDAGLTTHLSGAGWGSYAGDATIYNALYTDLWSDPITIGIKGSNPSSVLGPNWGTETSNMDGVLIAPGLDAVTGTGPGVRAPVASLQLKRLRRAAQDGEYLTRATANGHGAVAGPSGTLVASMVPTVLWEVTKTYGNGNGSGASWSANPDTWASARTTLQGYL